jgi:hypothetical protein
VQLVDQRQEFLVARCLRELPGDQPVEGNLLSLQVKLA